MWDTQYLLRGIKRPRKIISSIIMKDLGQDTASFCPYN